MTQEEWKHADNVFQTFGCLNLGDYHDLYLKTDTLLLACVFEEFRSLCYKTYGLDSAHYFTCSHLSGDAFLKHCKADIELLTDREHLEMVENMVRGGVASVFDKKFFKANNRYVAEHNYNTYGVLLDANNLYGGIMEKFPLPISSFETAQEFNLERILATTNDSEYGFVLEVDLHYPVRLHDGHEDFPLAPTTEQIYYKGLGERQQELLGVMGETRQNSQGKKAHSNARRQKQLHTTLPNPQTLCKPRQGSEESSPRTKIPTIAVASTVHGTEHAKAKRVPEQV